MKFNFFVKASVLGVAAAGCPAAGKDHEWIAARRQDSRSPCPGLNAMANHGFLPRSGKNISLDMVQAGVLAAYNFAPNTFDSPFADALAAGVSTTGTNSTFHLADLGKHQAVEFDGSLSRNDFYFGDDLHFDPVVWATMAARLNLYQTGPAEKDKYVTVEMAARARAARVLDAKSLNPTFNSSSLQADNSPGTSGLYLATLWDAKAGGAPKIWIRTFFEEERIPYAEGYSPQNMTQKTGKDIGVMLKGIIAANATGRECS